MSKWQSIDSAFKDGTLMLGYQKNKEPFIFYWGRSAPWNVPGWIAGHCRINHIDAPELWHSLPSLPELRK